MDCLSSTQAKLSQDSGDRWFDGLFDLERESFRVGLTIGG